MPLFLSLLVVFVSSLPANLSTDSPVGTVTLVRGKVDIRRLGIEKVISVKSGADIFPGDIIMTDVNSSAKVAFIDSSFVNIAPMSRLMVVQYIFTKKEDRRKAILLLMEGMIRVVTYRIYTGRGSTFIVKTPTAFTVSNKADLVVTTIPAETELVVLDGSVMVKNISSLVVGEVSLRTNQSSTVKENLPPIQPVHVTPQQRRGYIMETMGQSQ